MGRRRAAGRVPRHPERARGRTFRPPCRAARRAAHRPALRVRARELPARLDSDGRDLRGTLRAWISAGGNAERAAQPLGVHAQTVREHVRSAEPSSNARPLAAGSDPYEVVPAHVAAGDLHRTDLRGPAHRAESGHPDSRVHD
ncbi:helix-turn-helix domain-containing protein [Streptomyces sp. NPDC017435]|uniref:helix-turn-helix domain-containing protein n=1 Tax=Streptomyces sp. NPDC017435 TaxID=3364995 RepID=UPI0037A0CB23